MPPEISVNYLAVIVCVVVAMPLGFLWFGPLFGKAWAAGMGMNFEEKPEGMARSMILYGVGSLLIAFVLAHSIAIWRPSTWNADATDAGSWLFALNGAIWTWIGFFVPLQLGRVAWEKLSCFLI